MVSLAVLDVDLSWWQVGSVGLLILGLLLLSYDRLGTNKRQWTVVILALVTGGFIASYSIVDGLGARKMGYALAYWGWVAIGNGALMTLWMLLFQPTSMAEGSFILAKPYNSFIWAGARHIWLMALLPGPFKRQSRVITALRETSVIFALLIGLIFLRERSTPMKIVACSMTVVGVICLQITSG